MRSSAAYVVYMRQYPLQIVTEVRRPRPIEPTTW
jgi:hypothetical protein